VIIQDLTPFVAFYGRGMKVSLSKRLFLGFLIVILMMCATMSLVGLHFIDKTIVDRVQDKVRLDLRSGRDIYNEEAAGILEAIRFTALSHCSGEINLEEGKETLSEWLTKIAEREDLDILTLAAANGDVICRREGGSGSESTRSGRALVNRAVEEKTAVSFTIVMDEEELKNENPDLVGRAFVRVVRSPYLKSETRDHVSSGMVIVAAAIVMDEQGNRLGVLYGGRLLNNSTSLVDRIIKKICGPNSEDCKEVGLATIFLFDLRIATTVEQDNHQRAIGTLVSDDVHEQVLQNGQSWISRPFAVNSSYVTAYEPIRDMENQTVGMLSIGFLEDRFRDIQRNAFFSFLLITIGGLGLSLLLFYFFIQSTMRPINSLVRATERLAEGNLEEQVHLDDLSPEIAVLGRSFNEMAQSIRDRDRKLRLRAQAEVMKSERMAMIGQLAAGVAHEINNPLGSILLFNRLVMNKCPADSPIKENLERVDREVKRCQNIVQGLLEFARQRNPKVEPTDLNVLLEKTVALFENKPMFHNIEVVRQFQEGSPKILVDPSQIQQVFINIMMNAVDAMEGRGALTIATRYRPEKEKIEVRFGDTGQGMSKEVLNHIFEPFYTTKGVGRGTGLGLSISYGIIQRHSGEIAVSSQIGEGSVFVISLPREKGEE